MITIAVIGLVLPVVFSLIFAIVQQQLKIYRISEAKRQGDYIINYMETNIRNNAVAIYSDSGFTTELCPASSGEGSSSANNGSSFYFKHKDGTYFQYDGSGTQISVKTTSTPGGTNITTSKTRVDNFSIKCTRSAQYSAPFINLSFDICYNNNASCATSGRVEEVASLTYKTNIKLRNQ